MTVKAMSENPRREELSFDDAITKANNAGSIAEKVDLVFNRAVHEAETKGINKK